MLSQLKKEVCYVGREGVWAVPMKDGNRQAGVDDRIPKVNFRGQEVENGGGTKGDNAKGLKMR